MILSSLVILSEAIASLHFARSATHVVHNEKAATAPYNQAMSATLPTFREPTAVEKIFNRIFGFLVGLGLGSAHMLSAPSSRTQNRQALLDSGRSAGMQGQALSGRPSRTNAMGPQRRSRRRNHAEEGKHAPEIPSAPDPRRREAADSESLSRQLQARSAALLSGPRRLAAGSICCDSGKSIPRSNFLRLILRNAASQKIF